MKVRSLTRVPSYRHHGSPPRRRSPHGLLRRRCRRGSALLHPLHVTHRVCLLGDSIEEKGRKSDRTGKEIRCRVEALRRSTAPPIRGPPVQVDALGLVGAAAARVRRLRRPAYRFRRKAGLRQLGQGCGKPEGAPLRLPPEDATGAKATHRPRPWWVRRPRCRPAATTTRPGRAAAVGSAHGRARRWSSCSRIWWRRWRSSNAAAACCIGRVWPPLLDPLLALDLPPRRRSAASIADAPSALGPPPPGASAAPSTGSGGSYAAGGRSRGDEAAPSTGSGGSCAARRRGVASGGRRRTPPAGAGREGAPPCVVVDGLGRELCACAVGGRGAAAGGGNEWKG